MAKNKKPRKPYKARDIHVIGCYYPPTMVNRVKSLITNVQLTAEMVLPRGSATDNQMYEIQDLLNWIGFMIVDRKWPHPEQVPQVTQTHYEALHAYSRTVQRKRKRDEAEPGINHGYVCTADDLRTIQDVCTDLGNVLKEALELSPQRTVAQFLVAVHTAENEHVRREAEGLPHGVHDIDVAAAKRDIGDRSALREELLRRRS